MSRYLLSRTLNILVTVSILLSSLGSWTPVTRASAPPEPPIAPLAWPSTWDGLIESVPVGVGQQQIQVSLSPSSRNGLLSAWSGSESALPVLDRTAAFVAATTNRSPVLPWNWEGDAAWLSNAARIEWLSPENNSETASSANPWAWDGPALSNSAPELASPAAVEATPPQRRIEAASAISESHTLFLPIVLRSSQTSQYVTISPEGGSLTSPDGTKTITFASDGLPESLRVAFSRSSVSPRDLPINLYPFGSPFVIQARWVSGGTPVTVLDPEAQPIWEPGMAKPQPAQYRYWATISLQLSEVQARIADPMLLAIARSDEQTGKWTLLPTGFDRQTRTASALTEWLGTFVLVQNMPNSPAVTSSDVILASGETVRSSSAVSTTVEVIVDDLDPEFNSEQDPRVPGGPFWFDVPCGGTVCYEGHAYWTWNRSAYEDPWLPPGEPCNWATWTPVLPQTGYYLVGVSIPGSHADTQRADYKVYHAGVTDTLTVDQTANSGTFANLGAFEFNADGTEHLYLDDIVAETPVQLGSHVGYDAAFFVFGDKAPPSLEEIVDLFARGVQSWQKYVGDPVSSSTGNHVQQVEVVRIPGGGDFEMALMLFYNSLSDHAGLFGTGWSSLLDTRLELYYDDSVMVWLPDAQALYWQFDGSEYIGWDGVQGDLEQIGGGWKLTMPDQTAYIFQQVGWEGRLMRVEDRHGNGASLLYNGDGQVTALTDDAGRSLVFDYDGNHISQVEDTLGRTWGFGYADGHLTEFANAGGGTTQYTYDSAGYLETLTDPEGITYLQNFYDGQGRVVEQIDAGGSHSTWDYDDGNRTVTFADNLGHQAAYRYDELYRLVEEEDALGQTMAYEYDDDYNLTAQVDKMGRRWEYTYDIRGNILTETDPLDNVTTYTYNETNDLTNATDALGRTTVYVWQDGNLVRIERPDGTAFTYTYDGYGQMLTAADPKGHTTGFTYDNYGNLVEVRSPLDCVTRYTYDVVGRMTSMTDGNGHTMRVEYDGNDNITRITDPRGQHTDFEYDGNDSLVQMVDRRGGVWTYEYDENLKLVAETDPLGHTTAHTYDAMYNRVSTADPKGNTTTFRYNPLYRLIEVEDALGNLTRYEYDANDNLVRIVDALNQETELAYDELNRLVRVVDALYGVTEYHYDVADHLVRLVNSRGAETRYEYDDVDRLIRVIDALGGVTEYDYDDAGNLVVITDANEHTTHFGYDADDRLVEREDPEGHVTAYEYDCVGNLTRLVDGRGYPTAFEYDENDNLVRVTDALAGETIFTYDEEDNHNSVTDPNGNTTEFVYDLDGLLVQLIEAGGQVTRFEYDATHNLARLVNAKGNATAYEYDPLNRLIAETGPLTHTTTYEYDLLNRLIAVTDALSVTTRYEHDPLDRLAAVVQNDRPGEPADHETNVRTEYAYDSVGNLLTIADANGHVTTFEYDVLDRLIREVNPIGDIWRYEYDPVGNLTRRVDANEDVTDYTYDADDLLSEIAYPDGSGVTFAYDAAHNQVTMTDGLGTTTNAYDALNRLTSSANHLGQTVGYAYDPASNRVAVTYPDGRVVHTEYDPTNYPVRVIDPDGNIFAADYDPAHNVTAIHNPNLTRALMTYDDDGRLLSVLNEGLDGDLISSFAYTLDAVGNRVRSDEYYRWRQPRTLSHDYAYDPLYRLVGSQDSEGRFTEYTYDAVGNRLRMASNYDPLRTPTDVDPYTVDYTYNAANQMLTTDHSVFGVTDYSYDANGNRVRRQGPDVWIGNPHDGLRTDYTYDYENHLTWVGNFLDPGDGTWQVRDETSMLYDGYGRLFRRTHDMHQGGGPSTGSGQGGQKWVEYIYDGLDPIVEYEDPSPQYVNYYRGLGRILEMHEFMSQQSPAGTAYYYHYDGLGSVSALTKHGGQSAHTYRYWDYGMALDKNGRAADSSNFTDPHNHYTYTGQEWDEYTWLYHFYAREYDPVVGVWLQQDVFRGYVDAPSTLNRYVYVENNPVNGIDHLGYTRLSDSPTLAFPIQHHSLNQLNGLLPDFGESPIAGASASLRSVPPHIRGAVLARWGRGFSEELIKAILERVVKKLVASGRYLEFSNVTVVLREFEVQLTEAGLLGHVSISKVSIASISQRLTPVAKIAETIGPALPFLEAAIDAFQEAQMPLAEDRFTRVIGAATWSLGIGLLLGSEAPFVVVIGINLGAKYLWEHGVREAWLDSVEAWLDSVEAWLDSVEAWLDLVKYPPWSPKPAY